MPDPQITVHVIPASHPSRALIAAVRLKGAEHEVVVFAPGEHIAAFAEIYGEGNTTAPGIVIDGEPVHGSRPAFAFLDEKIPDPPLYPADRADEIREAERWGDEEFQDLGRWLGWGSMHFRPEYFATYSGGSVLDPEGTDFAIGFVRGAWKYHGLSAARIAEGLAALPAKLDHIDGLIAEGILDGDAPNAADLQVGSTIRVLQTLGDLRPLLDDRPAGRMARRWFPDYDGEVPAGALPAGWVPA